MDTTFGRNCVRLPSGILFSVAGIPRRTLLLIEKDFLCLHRASGQEQDDADALPNPLAASCLGCMIGLITRTPTGFAAPQMFPLGRGQKSDQQPATHSG